MDSMQRVTRSSPGLTAAARGQRQRRTQRAGRWPGTRGAVAAVLVAAVGLVSLLLLLPLTASTRGAVREITLVTRDMAFYLEGGTQPNPTIQMRVGEEVEVTLVNLDPGLKHNLSIQAWGLETRYVEADGSTTLRVRAPTRPGRQAYVCAPHDKMMRGIIEVVDGD